MEIFLLKLALFSKVQTSKLDVTRALSLTWHIRCGGWRHGVTYLIPILRFSDPSRITAQPLKKRALSRVNESAALSYWW